VRTVGLVGFPDSAVTPGGAAPGDPGAGGGSPSDHPGPPAP
jgi:hypothetical protein